MASDRVPKPPGARNAALPAAGRSLAQRKPPARRFAFPGAPTRPERSWAFLRRKGLLAFLRCLDGHGGASRAEVPAVVGHGPAVPCGEFLHEIVSHLDGVDVALLADVAVDGDGPVVAQAHVILR